MCLGHGTGRRCAPKAVRIAARKADDVPHGLGPRADRWVSWSVGGTSGLLVEKIAAGNQNNRITCDSISISRLHL